MMGGTESVPRVVARTLTRQNRRYFFSSQSEGCPTPPNFKNKLIREALRVQNRRTPERFLPFNSDSDEHVHKLWRDLMADPSKWWDNRPGKGNPKKPDFKHKKTGKALWLDSKRTPAWVSAEIVALFGSESDKLEKLWRDVFANPSKWWDNRTSTAKSRFPDFKCKQTGETLWVDNESTPEWAKLKITTLKSGDDKSSSEWEISETAKLKSEEFDLRWQDLFSNPTLWWDHRSRKKNLNFPDFIHKQSDEGLWLDGRWTPRWVSSRIDYLGPVTFQEDIVAAVERLCHYNNSGYFVKSMEIFDRMEQEGITPDCYIFLSVLQASAALGDLNAGRRVHLQIIKTGWEMHPHISSSLVHMYAKCGSIEDSLKLFDKMPTHDAVCWNAMIVGCANCGLVTEALRLFEQMQLERVEPTSITFLSLLRACASTSALDKGREVHQMIIGGGYEFYGKLGNSLIDMYAKCGSIEDARNVFDRMPTRNVVSWTTMIVGYVKCGQGMKALELFQQMQLDRVEPNSITYVSLLNACASIAALDQGRRVHQMITRTRSMSDAKVGNSLVNMYAKCGSIEEAREVFVKLPSRNVVSWNALIIGYVKCGQGTMALDLFNQMQREKVEPTSITYVSLLHACASIAAIDQGRRVHQMIIRRGYDTDEKVGSSLIDMYAKCGSIEDARSVFDNLTSRDAVSWTVMIVGCVQCGRGTEALELFQQMQCERVEPNSATFVSILKACASIAGLDQGRNVHQMIVRNGYESDVKVGSSLVDMYAKCGSIEDALKVFGKMPTRDSVSWNAMIMGLAMHGLAKEAVDMFEQMTLSGAEIDEVTFISLLSACCHGGLVNEGMHYFGYMQSGYGVLPTQEHYTIMVDLLGRAGHLAEAEAVIDSMSLEPCAATWKSLLGACRIHGNMKIGERAFNRILELDPINAAGYVLLSNTYAAACSSESKDFIQEQSMGKGFMKQSALTCTP